MTLEQIKAEIRRMRPNERIKLYRWLDYGVIADFCSRIGVGRSLEIRHAIDQKMKITVLATSPRTGSVSALQLPAHRRLKRCEPVRIYCANTAALPRTITFAVSIFSEVLPMLVCASQWARREVERSEVVRQRKSAKLFTGVWGGFNQRVLRIANLGIGEL